MHRPSNLIYSVDERPPLPMLLLLGLQHVAGCAVSWVIATVIVTGIGLPASEAWGVIQIVMIASGLGTTDRSGAYEPRSLDPPSCLSKRSAPRP